MERLTMRDKEGEPYWVDPDCSLEGYRVPSDAEDMERLNCLAAYEDIGLEPDAIIKAIKALDLFAEATYGVTLNRIRELVQAEKDGRLAILPCKVNDFVFDIQDGTPYRTRVLSFSCFGDRWACRTVSSYPDLEEFGSNVFLTREEAEAALERRTDT